MKCREAKLQYCNFSPKFSSPNFFIFFLIRLKLGQNVRIYSIKACAESQTMSMSEQKVIALIIEFTQKTALFFSPRKKTPLFDRTLSRVFF